MNIRCDNTAVAYKLNPYLSTHYTAIAVPDAVFGFNGDLERDIKANLNVDLVYRKYHHARRFVRDVTPALNEHSWQPDSFMVFDTEYVSPFRLLETLRKTNKAFNKDLVGLFATPSCTWLYLV